MASKNTSLKLGLVEARLGLSPSASHAKLFYRNPALLLKLGIPVKSNTPEAAKELRELLGKLRQERMQGKLWATKKELAKEVKKGKAFLVQKLSRKIKERNEKQEPVVKEEEKLKTVKELDVAALGDGLLKHLEEIVANENVPEGDVEEDQEEPLVQDEDVNKGPPAKPVKLSSFVPAEHPLAASKPFLTAIDKICSSVKSFKAHIYTRPPLAEGQQGEERQQESYHGPRGNGRDQGHAGRPQRVSQPRDAPTRGSQPPMAKQSRNMESYFLGSLADPTAKLEIDVPDRELRRNRPGQRARRAQNEQVYGSEAVHLKADKKADKARADGAREERPREKPTRPTSKPPQSKEREKSKKNQQSDADQHPSWLAKQREIEAIANAKFKGTKITFGDDD